MDKDAYIITALAAKAGSEPIQTLSVISGF